MFKQTAAVMTALFAVAAVGAFAQPKPLAQGKTMHGKMASGKKTVYVCTDCKKYYTPSEARKMGYKDPDGGRLVKRAGIPAGYKPGDQRKPCDKR